MSQVLEHMADPLGALGIARRALAPTGLLYLSVTAYDWLRRYCAAQSEKQALDLWRPETHYYYFSPRAMRRLLRRAGLEPASTQPTGSGCAARSLHGFAYSALGLSTGHWFVVRSNAQEPVE